mgnify:FL=1
MKGGIRAERDTTFEEFSALLMQEHGVAVKENGGHFSGADKGLFASFRVRAVSQTG